ncbi:MAG: hypothetical protein ABIA12_02645 [Candidatus Aenigmatarchaeota archaeon]
MDGLSVWDEMRLSQAGAYVFSSSPEVKPLISYILEKKQVTFSGLSHDLFYFGDKGLNWHLDQLHQLGAIDIDFQKDRTIIANPKAVKFEGKNYGMLSIVADFIERELEQFESGPEGRLNRARNAAECLYRNLNALLAVRSQENVMPYTEFLEVNKYMSNMDRLLLKHYGLLGFGRDAAGTATVYLDKNIADALDALQSV